jgi:hypothetical protein
MFSKFKSAITGYKINEVSVNGLKVITKYKGKIPNSNPLATIIELKVKLNQNPEVVPLTLDFSKCWEDRLVYLKGVHPSSISRFAINNNQYTVSRYVTKQKKSPLSLYTFSVDEKIFALFSRVYDYGDYFKEIENDLCSKHNFVKSKEDRNLHHITDGSYSAVVDVFGHSQCFLWNDHVKLETCLEAI